MSLPKVQIENPKPLVASEGAKSAARLRSKSSEQDALKNGIDAFRHGVWSPTSWQGKPIKQDVLYDDEEEVERALKKLESLPPLVHPKEINSLKKKLQMAAEGKAFVLQGGDCAELFDYCNQEKIEGKLKVLLQMSLVLIWAMKLPVVRVGRIAGQYAKPRSQLTEVVDGKEIPSFRGDNVNGFDVSERRPDPERLVKAYFHSAATLNFIRSSLGSGFADLNDPFEWDLSHVKNTATKERYEDVVKSLNECLEFMSTIGINSSSAEFSTVDFFTSHEALLLEYEQSLTRKLKDPEDGEFKWFNTSAHFIWIGDRTRQLDCSHVEFFRGVQNPIGVKVGPTMKDSELVDLLDILDADCEVGRVTLITRYGADKIEKHLPGHIQAVKKTKHKVVWVCDPCHGNTKKSPITQLKTRYFEDIITELTKCLAIHQENNNKLNGVHLELTGDAVTECIGGTQQVEDNDLSIRYETYCDPRLNETQSLDAAFLIADYFRGGSLMKDINQE